MRQSAWNKASAILICCFFGCGSPDVSSDSGRLPSDEFLQVGDVRLHYIDWGGNGDLLLFVPGLSATARIYDGIAPAFTDEYRVVAMTRRGHGLSATPSTPEVTIDLLADEVAAVIAGLTDRPAVVVGHSFAGIEFPRLAARHPDLVAAFVFLDAVYNWPLLLEPGPSLLGFESDSTFTSFTAAEDSYRATFPELSSPVALKHLRSKLRLRDDGLVVWRLPWSGPRITAFLNSYADWSGDEYQSITVPVLSIQADQEKIMIANLRRRGFPPEIIDSTRAWNSRSSRAKAEGAALLRTAVPDAVFMMFDSTHHDIQVQRPVEVITAIEDFLRTVD